MKKPEAPWDQPRPPKGPRLAGSPHAIEPSEHPQLSGQPKGRGRRSPSPDKGKSKARLYALVGAGAFAALLLVLGVLASRPEVVDPLDVNEAALSVVQVHAPACGWAGSGTVVSSTGLILTNSHVATDAGSDVCQPEVGFTEDYAEEPTEWYAAAVVVDDVAIDLAVLQLLDDAGRPTSGPGRPAFPFDTSEPPLGDEIQTLGYPGAGGMTLTYTSGDFAGVNSVNGDLFYKTTASMNPGVSGGGAFSGEFALIGVPTAGRGIEVICESGDCSSFGDSIGLIRPIEYAVPMIEDAKRIVDSLD